MALPREEVRDGTAAELQRFEDLVRSLTAKDWETPTRCDGWTVAAVAAHVTGTMSWIVNGRLGQLTEPDATAQQVAERADKSPSEVADELHEATKLGIGLFGAFDDTAWVGPPPLDIPGTLGEAVEAIWYDTFVHGDDIRVAIGRKSEAGPGLRAAVSHLSDLLTHKPWGPATLELDGIGSFDVSGGGGQRITGDPMTFVLVATGRADPSALGLDPSVNVYG